MEKKKFKNFEEFKKEIFPKSYKEDIKKKEKEDAYTYGLTLAKELLNDIRRET